MSLPICRAIKSHPNVHFITESLEPNLTASNEFVERFFNLIVQSSFISLSQLLLEAIPRPTRWLSSLMANIHILLLLLLKFQSVLKSNLRQSFVNSDLLKSLLENCSHLQCCLFFSMAKQLSILNILLSRIWML